MMCSSHQFDNTTPRNVRRPAAASATRRPRDPTIQHVGIVTDFKQAWEARDIDALIGLLDPASP